MNVSKWNVTTTNRIGENRESANHCAEEQRPAWSTRNRASLKQQDVARRKYFCKWQRCFTNRCRCYHFQKARPDRIATTISKFCKQYRHDHKFKTDETCIPWCINTIFGFTFGYWMMRDRWYLCRGQFTCYSWHACLQSQPQMMTSSNGKKFPRYWPFVRNSHQSKASDAVFWCFL